MEEDDEFIAWRFGGRPAVGLDAVHPIRVRRPEWRRAYSGRASGQSAGKIVQAHEVAIEIVELEEESNGGGER